MKYALITDNNVGWFTFLVAIVETGEVAESYSIDSGLTNDYLSNLFNREPSFFNLRLMIPFSSMDTFAGTWISGYDFNRIKKMIQLYPKVLEYNMLGRLEKVD